MNNLSKIAGYAIVLAFLSASPVIAKNPDNQGKSDSQKNSNGNSQKSDKGNSQKADSKNKDKHDNHHEVHYAGIDRSKTRQYAKQYNVGYYKPLPPGIRKNLARGKPIPPGIAKTRLPAGYINQLPRYNGYEWRGYGGDLVLLDSRTQLIADVIMDAFR